MMRCYASHDLTQDIHQNLLELVVGMVFVMMVGPNIVKLTIHQLNLI